MSFRIMILVILLLKPIASASEGASRIERRAESAIRLARQFYQELAAEDPTYPEMFGLAHAPNEMSTRQIWDYLRGHRQLFFPERVIEEGSLSHFFDSSVVSVMFVGANRRDLGTAGLCVVLRYHLPKPASAEESANAGVMKVVCVPISWCSKTGEPQVGYLAISINGVLIDPYGEFARRDYDLFDSLGFTKEETDQPQR